MQKDPINTIPLEQFLQQVKTAKQSNAKDVKLSMQQAEVLALTIGQLTTRLHGDLEKLVAENLHREENQTINVEMDGGGFKGE